MIELNLNYLQSLPERFVGSLLLEPRSVLVLQESAYTSCLHDISDNTLLDLVNKGRVLNWSQTQLGAKENELFSYIASNGNIIEPLNRINYDCKDTEQENSESNDVVGMERRDFMNDSESSKVVLLPSNERDEKTVCAVKSFSNFIQRKADLSSSFVHDSKIEESDIQTRAFETELYLSTRNFRDEENIEPVKSIDIPAKLDVNTLLSGCGNKGDVIVGCTKSTSTDNNKSFILQRGTRVSLTIRRVPKIIKSKLFFGKR